jgi:hypothetical protein
MRPYLITAKLMRPSNMKRFPTLDSGLEHLHLPELMKSLDHVLTEFFFKLPEKSYSEATSLKFHVFF